ncbi:AraC family transcriptional regulator [Brevibacterium salitolerans]|uniref:HTH araC/xylS-type domain-containing protein n=1 Tax=Brevibacterium salitolerans TaxID=1403566 RepID=A0ABP5IA05_9MICO
MNAHVRADFGSVSVSIHRLDAATGLDLDLGTDALHLLVARGGDLRIVLRPHEGGTVSRSATGPQPAADGWPATAGRTASQVCDGEGALLHSLADCELFTAEGCESVVISVPLELAAELEGFSDVGTAPLLLAGTPMLLMPMAAFASQAARGDGASASALSVYYVEKLIQEMMLGIVAHTARISRVLTPRDAYSDALDVIAAQYADPTLSSDRIAAAVNMSRRQLERLVARRGASIRGTLRSVRVQQAAELLQDETYDALSTARIAQHVGYGGASSLARAFAQEGYDPPSALRSGARAAS